MRRTKMPSYAVVLVTTGLCSLGCARQSPPGVIHLLPPGVAEEPLLIGTVARMGFARPLEDSVEISLRVPGGQPELRLACALGPLPGRHPQGKAVFKASVIGPDETVQAVWKQTLSPGHWTEGAVDLAGHVGSTVRLTLEAMPGEAAASGRAYWATPMVTAGAGTRPNVLLICIDTLRADHLGCYGYDRPTSPTLDSLARAGCLFTNVIAQSSWTLPSHASLFTSLHAGSHGVGSVWEALAPDVPTVAGLLRDSGYATGAVISSRSLDPGFGIANGFDRYDLACCTGLTDDVRNPCTNTRAAAWLHEWKESPFFLFVHYWDVHAAYVPPAPYNTIFMGDVPPKRQEQPEPRDSSDALSALAGARERDVTIAQYDGEIAHTDRSVKLLLGELERLGLSERTLVIVTSDHGEEFLDHLGWGHGQTLYQETIHVPLLWVEPKGRHQGCLVDRVVQLVDVAPSVLDFLGLSVPEEMEGTSFLGTMADNLSASRSAFSEVRAQGGLHAVITDHTKLIYSLDRGEMTAYDLASDPEEQHPLSPTAVEGGAELEKTVRARVPPWELDPIRLEVRLTGTGARCRVSVSTAGRPFRALQARGLEPGDLLQMREDSSEVLLRSECAKGDADGYSLTLPSRASVLAVEATGDGAPLTPDRIFLGSGKHPVDGRVPIKVQLGDRRLRVRSNATLPDSSLEPGLHFWVAEEHQAASVPAELDPKLERSLRALGYLQ